LGGANLKLAVIEDGRVVDVAQIPCPIRQDARKFNEALEQALPLCPADAAHGVTMTGELSDVFPDRAEGVAYLVDMMQRATGGKTLFYGGRSGFLDCSSAVERPGDVASANWHATATFAAQSIPDGLLIDVGTTTTDLIPLKDGKVAARAYSDGERLAEGELIYSGAVRTPVMAVAHAVPFKGRMQRIAAERFATMADVWRLLGKLAPDADPYPTPDLKGKSIAESAARLARMLGRDGNEASLLAFVEVARHFADCQLANIEAAARDLLARDALAADAPVIGAGCGRFIAREIADRLGAPYCDFADMLGCTPAMRERAATCAPAVAIGLLVEHAFASSLQG
jgi:probable H4MPT-linked C1 transfer pathway protein